MNYDYNPFTGQLDSVGAGSEEIEQSQQSFYGATAVSDGDYFGKIATFRMKTGQREAHHIVACFHIMRCNTQPYISSNRPKVTNIKECTLFVSASSIHYEPHPYKDVFNYGASMVFDSSYGINSEEIRLNVVGYEDGYCVMELWGKLEYKDRLFFTCRWNQLDKEYVSLTIGTPDDDLVYDFPDLPVFYPKVSDTSEHDLYVAAHIPATYEHNLNKYPSVTFIDEDGDMVLADVHYDNRNSVTVTFEEDFVGKMILN